jgi:glycosyltransferase involved in cell wall biosynthesis
MRILTVCASTKVFGAEVITLKLLEGFKKRGHDQVAITSIWTDGEFNRRLAAIGVAEVRMPFGFLSKVLKPQPLWWTAKVLARAPLLWWQWRRLVRRFQPEVILFTTFRQPLLLRPALRRDGASFLIEHTYLEPTLNRRRVYALLEPKLSGFVGVSAFMGKHLRKVGAPKRKIFVVKNGPFSEEELAALGGARRNDDFAKRPPTIGIVGQISASKGYNVLVEAARILKESGSRFKLLIFGDGEADYVGRLKEKIGAAGLDETFRWMGYENDKSAIFRAIDICVVPSQFEDPFPTAAIEASAYGVPVIATCKGGLPEIVEDGVTGWLVDADAPDQLAERIDWLIRHPGEARAMGAAGHRKVALEFTQERMVSDFEHLFRNAKDSSTSITDSHAR